MKRVATDESDRSHLVHSVQRTHINRNKNTAILITGIEFPRLCGDS